MKKTKASKHIRSFWPLVIVISLSFIAGGAVMWATYNFNVQENMDSTFSSYLSRPHKNILDEKATQKTIKTVK